MLDFCSVAQIVNIFPRSSQDVFVQDEDDPEALKSGDMPDVSGEGQRVSMWCFLHSVIYLFC